MQINRGLLCVQELCNYCRKYKFEGNRCRLIEDFSVYKNCVIIVENINLRGSKISQKQNLRGPNCLYRDNKPFYGVIKKL
jgi:hypothetical protein